MKKKNISRDLISRQNISAAVPVARPLPKEEIKPLPDNEERKEEVQPPPSDPTDSIKPVPKAKKGGRTTEGDS